MKKVCKEQGWVRKYRAVLWLVLVLVLLLSGWYGFLVYEKNKVPEDATLVEQQEVCDEGNV